MSGCAGCAASGGCETRKTSEADLLAELLPALYPSRRWGELSDGAREGVPARAGRRLARQAAELLQAPARWRAGAANELCDYLDVLCVGREPGLLALVDAESMEPPEAGAVSERWLRAALSSVAPVVTVQEVVMDLTVDGDVCVLVERTRPGVFDPVLLARARKLVDLIVGAGLTYLDFGQIDHPPLGFSPGDYAEQYGGEPGIVNYLFYPQPATAVTTRFIPCAVPEQPSR